MIHVLSAVIFAAYLLIGPFGIRHVADTLILFGFMASALAVALVSNRSSHQQSIALMFVLAALFYESLRSITSWLNVELTEVRILGEKEALHAVSFFFTLNVGLAIIGVAAAVIVAISLEVRKTCLPLARLFPEVKFLTATTELASSVAGISRTAGIAPPNVSLIDSGDPAAFITRSRHGFELAVSVGLLESLSKDELEACIAHELSHEKNNDFAFRSFATSARIALFAHPMSHLIEPAIYRAREFLADKTAVQLIGGRDSLVSALAKIRESQDYITSQPGSIATACLFDPASKNGFLRLFDKHPSLDARIKALRES
jgi:Zn-dependent protease with chaperone function